MALQDLKAQYEVLRKKYSLPEFIEVNRIFEIEKIDKESEILLKVIRRVIMEKVVNFLGFIEMLLNPVNIPRVYMGYIRGIAQSDRKSIEKIYNNLSELNLKALHLEVEYSEKGEAELIKEICKAWNDLKPDFKLIFENINKAWSANETRKERSYFG